MRTFSSYGQINTRLHYYAPRTALIERAHTQLIGETAEEGGHYITVWAPRQTGKSTVMLEVLRKIKQTDEFHIAILTMQSARNVHTVEGVLRVFCDELQSRADTEFPVITSWEDLPKMFTPRYFSKPLILILDEFDVLDEEFVNGFANEFRKIYTDRLNQIDTPTHEKRYLLHSLALIGVRSVLGIENVTGSPFNVQRSLHIPNLTFEEVNGMFQWYQQENGQSIEPAVVERLFDETRGHPGLTCWFGELLTETYNEHPDQPLTMSQFEYVLMWATQGLPNNTVLNIISKAKQPPYTATVLKIFETREKQEFRYDNAELNYLYLNGVIDIESTPENLYARFPSPFVQKRLFNYFANDLFHEMGQLVEPFTPLDTVMTGDGLSIPHLLSLYQAYLHKNRGWLFKDAPRRVDLRIREAVYHFNLYIYLHQFLHTKGARVWPEFPTGNGKLDILILYRERLYGLEVKSFADLSEYKKALVQAASYGKQLSVHTITLVFFIESIDDENRRKYEAEYVDAATGVSVTPLFIETGL